MSSESHGPPEVRSEEFPLGFPWLQGVLRDCVASANSIYIHMALFFFWLLLFGLVVGRPCHHLFTSYISYEDYKSEWVGHLTSFRYAVPLVLLLQTLSWLRAARILEIRRSLRAKKKIHSYGAILFVAAIFVDWLEH